MCVGVPGKVIERDEYTAIVEVMGSRMKVGIILVPDVQVGDYVLVHAGKALQIVDEEYARASAEAWALIGELREQGVLEESDR
ncbi:HypC/HybG/HupF family hydrogenase formation chaperone [Hydrogenibacillus sp. N12]|uniref:HypC/HybG/HupF family hydrogenase formation chaperone n=1 Tax=Hydrogenibacillus sp. N12 TaxID=2866627 RepID=UPI001C7D1270|nr:HypC/HybG/HupF family hydrogenase formation chaperone [Hydrogenibacillus sp. N12]QZA32301.1 HypC/HybG/HupF family hydrogenase formation chaperone [Hydrogenibacillus sp. N12]